MVEPEAIFYKLVEKLTKEDEVSLGKMMSSPGLQFKKKNFAFYFKERMCFKLGKEFNIDAAGVSSWEHLSPFKTKPPLTAWYFIGYEDKHLWSTFAEQALNLIKESK